MPEPAANHDLIEHANLLFWNPPSLEDLMADVAPLDPGEHFDGSLSLGRLWQRHTMGR